MYMPAIDGCDAPCSIELSKSAAWVMPAPIRLV